MTPLNCPLQHYRQVVKYQIWYLFQIHPDFVTISYGHDQWEPCSTVPLLPLNQCYQSCIQVSLPTSKDLIAAAPFSRQSQPDRHGATKTRENLRKSTDRDQNLISSESAQDTSENPISVHSFNAFCRKCQETPQSNLFHWVKIAPKLGNSTDRDQNLTSSKSN